MKEAEDLIYKSYLRAIDNINETDDALVKKPNLTRELFNLLNDPDTGQKFILVTGSKGKGSTARCISSLLGYLGFKVGLFTSPHLVNFNERIRINGVAISDQAFIRLSNKIVEPFHKIEERLSSSDYQGPIGVSLAIAAMYFKENKTDINVIECGRGGKFDDTNILNNEWAVITPIMEEHITQLGPTIDDIISHKLGIIKPSTNFVYISKQDELLLKINAEIKVKNARYYGEDFRSLNVEVRSDGTLFDVKTKNWTYGHIKLPLLGGFHAINVATAIQVCEDIYQKPINKQTVNECFSSLNWPGRCEIIDYNPTVIIDGAINEKTAKYVQELLDHFKGKTIVSIVGVPANKDYKGVIKVVSQFSKKIILTKPDISHLIFPTDAKEFADTLLIEANETELLAEAVQLAKEQQSVDVILIVGTQTLIANAKRIWGQSLLDIGL